MAIDRKEMKLSVNITKDDYKTFQRFVKYHIYQTHWMSIALVIFFGFIIWQQHEPGTELGVKICTAIIVPLFMFVFGKIADLLFLGLRKSVWTA